MAGFYLHIPFCARRCPYCDFAIHVGAKAQLQENYVAALHREIECIAQTHEARVLSPLRSVFFGGGTPTMLPAKTLGALLQKIKSEIGVAREAEISIEANPENLNEHYLDELRAAGFNRLSMGAQSFDDEALKRVGRRHTSTHIEAAFAAARRTGWENISLDLMFALPGQSAASWRDTLQRALALSPEHMSCYSLTIEDGTAFARRVEKGRLEIVPDEAQAELMNEAFRLAKQSHVARYEVSNYARAGYECRHNLNYWRGGNYLAAGCGAHGHFNGKRWWNVRDASQYAAQMLSTQSARDGEETLSPIARLNERLMLGVRLREGFSPDELSQSLQLPVMELLQKNFEEVRTFFIEEDDAARGRVLRLKPEAFALADAIAVKLMVVTPHDEKS